MDMNALYRTALMLAEMDQHLGVQFAMRPPPVEQTATKKEEVPETPAAPKPIEIDTTLPAAAQLAAINELLLKSTPLFTGTRNCVPGEGNPNAQLMFIGEGPGKDEDAQGRPFVGAAGQLLDKMINAMGLKREDVFIANIVKWRPPRNRTPTEEEAALSMPWLEAQIQAVQPNIICALGNTPLRALKNNYNIGITRARGRQFLFGNIPVIPTYHPSYLLRNPAAKKDCWTDLQLVLEILGLKTPKRS